MTIAILDTGYGYKYKYSTRQDLVFDYDFYHNDTSAYDSYNSVTHFDKVKKAAEEMGYRGKYVLLKVFSDDDFAGKSSYVVNALEWLVQNAITYNITTVSMSLGTILKARDATTISEFDSYFKYLYDNNIMVTIAAGNYGANHYFPAGISRYAASHYAMAVSASNKDGTQADYSSYSPYWTDVVANGDLYFDGVWTKGTSYSTPRVAGLYEVVKDKVEAERGYTLTPYEFKVANTKIADKIAFRFTDLSRDDYAIKDAYKDTPRLAKEEDFIDYFINTNEIVGLTNEDYGFLSDMGNKENLNTLHLSNTDMNTLMLFKQDNVVYADDTNDYYKIFFSFDKYNDSSDDDEFYNAIILEGTESDWERETLFSGYMEKMTNDELGLEIDLIGIDYIGYSEELI